MKSVLKLDHIQKYYGNEGSLTQAIRDISFCVDEGNFWELWGRPAPAKPRF